MSVPASVDQARQSHDDVTTLLRDWRNGNQSALDRLTPLIYEDLIRLARARLKGERREFTLDPTALVHECYLRLADQTRLDVESRAHFYSIAANVMRRVLIDNARKRNAQKRNAGLRITLKTGIDFAEAPRLDAVVLDDALRKLADFDERKSQAITLKFFGGMTTDGSRHFRRDGRSRAATWASLATQRALDRLRMNSGAHVNRWKLIEDIFHSALEFPLSDRAAYLARACGDDAELRSEVASLLENDRDDTATIHRAVDGDLKRLAEAADHGEIGERVGPYRLVRELDGGGMGTVYLAVRSDDHYFQIVALKMVRKGMESLALLQRFRAERQILATLTHPNIGAILDGGNTEDGRPYLVMEYVEGQPITAASETRGLSIRERIELFRSLCSAVHYAHQKLVIHRDIKPNNVMVTPEGTVKLIDFGISKPLAPELIPGELARTEDGQRLMTPDYASPEQVLGQPVSRASDIYSLGVLLFELLTGSRPYTLGKLAPAAAARVVCEQENRKPSSVPELSKQTKRELAGDLDTVVLKAMEKDPSRRYPTAGDLDEDLHRVLQGKPIPPRPLPKPQQQSAMLSCAA